MANKYLHRIYSLCSAAIGAATHIVAPRVCDVCGTPLVDDENVMCLSCSADLPRTNQHVMGFNAIHHRLQHHVAIGKAAAWFWYDRDSRYANIIRNAKYHDRPRQARELAAMFAAELKPSGFFDGIDVMVPVPMHWYKQMRRGFNQSIEIAIGLSRATGIPVAENALVANRRHKSQTRQSARGRETNVSGIVQVAQSDRLSGKHVLIVDDIITTGATMLDTVSAASTASPASINILVLAMVH